MRGVPEHHGAIATVSYIQTDWTHGVDSALLMVCIQGYMSIGVISIIRVFTTPYVHMRQHGKAQPTTINNMTTLLPT